jgi:hypothetical protein
MRHRLFQTLHARQETDGCATNVIAFIQAAMDPPLFIGNAEAFGALREGLNEALAFSGLHVGEDGRLAQVTQAQTFDLAQQTRRWTSRRDSGRRSLLSIRLEFDYFLHVRKPLQRLPLYTRINSDALRREFTR